MIGAGPAGAWCACRLAAAGAKVALIDGSHPREKPCGGGVTGRALAVIGNPADSGTRVHVESATFAYEGRRAEVPLAAATDRIPLGVFPRREFDAQLVERARQAGATLIVERALEVSQTAGDWTIVTRSRAGRAGCVRNGWSAPTALTASSASVSPAPSAARTSPLPAAISSTA